MATSWEIASKQAAAFWNHDIVPGLAWDQTADGDSRPGPGGRQLPDSFSQSAVLEAVQDELKLLKAPTSNTEPVLTNGWCVHGAWITVYLQLEEVLTAILSQYEEGFCCFSDDPFRWFVEPHPVKGFKRFLRGPHGIAVKAEPAWGSGYVCVELPGGCFEECGAVPFDRLIKTWHDQGVRWHLSRIDAAHDGGPLSPGWFFRQICQGNIRSNAERDTVSFRNTPFGAQKGQTCYFGSRGSADYLRVYNSRETGNRVEHEMRKHRARAVGLELAESGLGQWHLVFTGHLRDFVDIVQAGRDANISRCPLVKAWSVFVQGVERAQMKISDLARSIHQRAVTTQERVRVKLDRVRRSVLELVLVMGWEEFQLACEEVELGADRQARAGDLKSSLAACCRALGCSVRSILSGAYMRPWAAG